MKLQINKGQIDLIGTIKESKIIDKTASIMMGLDSDITIISTGSEHEYFITMSYDSRFNTIEGIREVYRLAKLTTV